MSASWSTSQERQRRRVYRRPRRNAVPVEIDTHASTSQSPVASSSLYSTEKKQTNNSLWENSKPSIEILPGSLLIPEGEPWQNPPEPAHSPPVPTEIIQLLILGEHGSGKTSIAKRFQRMHCTHCFAKTTKNSSATRKRQQQWSVEYSKKDVTLWKSKDTVACARVQLWDVTGGGPYTTYLERKIEWIRLVQKMSGILLTISIEHGPQHLCQRIVEWKRWLDECCPCHPQVHLFLQKCDLLPSQTTNPLVWIDFGSHLSKLCNEVGIADWHMTTCATKSADQSPEQAIMELVKDLVTTTVPLQKRVSFETSSPSRSDKGKGKADRLKKQS